MELINTATGKLFPKKFEDNSGNPGSLDGMLWNLTDHEKTKESNYNLREAIRFEIDYITQELDYHSIDTLVPPYWEGLIDFQVKGSLLRCNLSGGKMMQDNVEVNACLTPKQKGTLNSLLPVLIPVLVKAQAMYKKNPEAEIKIKLVGHEDDNYQLFVEKRERDGKIVLDLTNEIAGVNEREGTSVQFGRLMTLVVLSSEEKKLSQESSAEQDISFII